MATARDERREADNKGEEGRTAAAATIYMNIYGVLRPKPLPHATKFGKYIHAYIVLTVETQAM